MVQCSSTRLSGHGLLTQDMVYSPRTWSTHPGHGLLTQVAVLKASTTAAGRVGGIRQVSNEVFLQRAVINEAEEKRITKIKYTAHNP